MTERISRGWTNTIFITYIRPHLGSACFFVKEQRTSRHYFPGGPQHGLHDDRDLRLAALFPASVIWERRGKLPYGCGSCCLAWFLSLPPPMTNILFMPVLLPVRFYTGVSSLEERFVDAGAVAVFSAVHHPVVAVAGVGHVCAGAGGRTSDRDATLVHHPLAPGVLHDDLHTLWRMKAVIWTDFMRFRSAGRATHHFHRGHHPHAGGWVERLTLGEKPETGPQSESGLKTRVTLWGLAVGGRRDQPRPDGDRSGFRPTLHDREPASRKHGDHYGSSWACSSRCVLCVYGAPAW